MKTSTFFIVQVALLGTNFALDKMIAHQKESKSTRESLALSGFTNDSVVRACQNKNSLECQDTLSWIDNQRIAIKLQSYDSVVNLRAKVAESLGLAKIADSLKVPTEMRKYVAPIAQAVRR